MKIKGVGCGVTFVKSNGDPKVRGFLVPMLSCTAE